MAIGERIRFIRNLRGITQKKLGASAGLPERTADIRIAQYESGTRVPKAELTARIAEVLDVSVSALDVPNIETTERVLHTLFALEDLVGLEPDEINGETILRLNTDKDSTQMRSYLIAWLDMAHKLQDGAITKPDYDDWRYRFTDEKNADFCTKEKEK